jgi:tRNA threonylcarbamoyladenosine biosynthesis protein TsaE
MLLLPEWVASQYYMERMNTGLTLSISTASSAETEKLGERLGSLLRGGEVIELVSDLGGGKTTLVRGIAKGFGSTDKVASPTFTVSKEYHSGNMRIVHYDFYRLQDPGLLEFELAESLQDPQAVTIIEWADIVHDVLPKDRITIRISSTGENTRSFGIAVPDDRADLQKGLL